jgi:acetyl/propionyl-CoA carboxylase alpha subunit
MDRMISKILIANRGEIAVRVMKTARRLGIPTVAVYSAVDADSLHVTLADESYCIGESELSETYLNIAKIRMWRGAPTATPSTRATDFLQRTPCS